MTINRGIVSKAYKGSYNIKIIVYDDRSTFKDANIYETNLKLEYFEISEKQNKTGSSLLTGDQSGIKVGASNITNKTDVTETTKLNNLNITKNSTNATVVMKN